MGACERIFHFSQNTRWPPAVKVLRTPIAAEDSHRCQFTFLAITWIRLFGSRQNLAWTYYLTLGTSLRKNFSFFSKSKMAAAAITANYEIAHNLKSIQLRDPIFFPRPMFSRVRNAMKLSFWFYDLGNYLKIQNGRRRSKIFDALYFFNVFAITSIRLI